MRFLSLLGFFRRRTPQQGRRAIVFEKEVALAPGQLSGIEIVRIDGVRHVQYVSPPYHVIEERMRLRKA